MFPHSPQIVDALAQIIVAIELKTKWSYDQATDAFVLSCTVGLLAGSRLLSSLTNLFLHLTSKVHEIGTGQLVSVSVDNSILKQRWLLIPVLTWAMSVAIVHAFSP